MPQVDVLLDRVSKHYGPTVAVENVDLHIQPGEFVSLLGPSGCGKTTTLRMLGGFVDVTSGRVVVGGRDVSNLPPNLRNMGFVFQSYALFPHMTISENVAFGLKMRGVGRSEIETRVRSVLDRVRLAPMGERLPKQLSGGQQQRVALARALVIEPDVLLLDEPLSNLDATLRHEMKIEIRQLQQSLGLTTIFVTHDQDEALSTSDRMVVMRVGRVEQVGTPSEIYNSPSSRFVAEFMGVPNLLRGQVTPGGGFRLSEGPEFRLGGQKRLRGECLLALRPEVLSIAPAGQGGAAGENSLEGTVSVVTYHGAAVEYRVHTRSGEEIAVRATAPSLGGGAVLDKGTPVTTSWGADAGVLVFES